MRLFRFEFESGTKDPRVLSCTCSPASQGSDPWRVVIEPRGEDDVPPPNATGSGPPLADVPFRLFSLSMAHDHRDDMSGRVPLQVGRYILAFRIRGVTFGEIGLRVVSFPNDQAGIFCDPVLYERLFATISESFPDHDAVYISRVPQGSLLWDVIESSYAIRERFMVHYPEGVLESHSIPLPATFQEYAAKLTGKKRYNLNRDLRRLREEGGGRFELRKITRRDEVETLYQALASFHDVPHSTRFLLLKRAEYERLADQGFLLCYLLYSGDRPCAAFFGTKHQDRFYGERLARDQRMDQFSPGTLIQHLAIEDLITNEKISLIDLGVGRTPYKYTATHLIQPCVKVLLLRKSLRNRVAYLAHRQYWTLIRLLKSGREAIGFAGPPAGASRGEEGLQDGPLLVRQITRVWLRFHALSMFETLFWNRH